MFKKLRRTMLFSPANSPKMLFTSQIYQPDCIIFDLEDAIKYAEKSEARDLLVEALKSVDYGDCEIFARINPLYTEFGEDDVRELVAAGLTRIRLPMCEKAADIEALDALLGEVEAQNGLELGLVKIQGAIETPLGVINAFEIANASERVISISFGAEDFTRSLGVDRSAEGTELLLARSTIVMAAAAAGVDAIDTVYSNVKDLEGFEKEVKLIKQLGFVGKSCIHPNQIEIVHKVFTPSDEEIQYSREVLAVARKENIQEGGVVLLNGKMIDVPVIAKARSIVNRAQGLGRIGRLEDEHDEN